MFLPVLFLLLASLPDAAPPKPDLVLENGFVYTAPDARPRRLSILIGEGKILFLGEPAKARKLQGEARVVDLGGAYVYAGWADAHLHLLGLGRATETANLRGLPDADAAARAIQSAAASLPAASWAEGRGWDQNLWPGKEFPDARTLDRVLPDRPALARRVDGHAVWGCADQMAETFRVLGRLYGSALDASQIPEASLWSANIPWPRFR